MRLRSSTALETYVAPLINLAWTPLRSDPREINQIKDLIAVPHENPRPSATNSQPEQGF